MTSVLIVAIVVVAIALTVRSARRALAERDAVDRHHRTLDLLGSLAERAEPVVPPTPAPKSAPGEGVAVGEVAARGYQPRHRAARRGRRPARLVAGVVLLAGIGVAAGAWLRAAQNPGRPATVASVAPRLTTTTHAVPPTATTAATMPVVLVASDSQQASYTVQQPSADIELVFASACWVEIRSGSSSGPVVFMGTLRAGTRKPVPTTGGSTVLLGNPLGVSVAVNGAPLAFPRPSGAKPFTLRFQPPA